MGLALAERRERLAAKTAAPPEREPREIQRHISQDDVRQAIPTILKGTDERRHESDILFIAKRAMDSGVADIAALNQYLVKQEMLAKRSSMWSDGGRHPSPPPIQQIAQFMRYADKIRSRIVR